MKQGVEVGMQLCTAPVGMHATKGVCIRHVGCRKTARARAGRGAVVVIGALMTRRHVVVGGDVVLHVVVAVVQATFVVVALYVQ